MTKKNHYTRREVLSSLALIPAILAVPGVDLWGNPSPQKKKKYVSLFDGKTLSGWHTNKEKIIHGTGGRWWVENGAIKCEQDPPGNGGMLMTDKKYGDFELELDLWPDWGIDSGIFIRTNDKGECFQIYVDYHDNGLVGFISTEGGDRLYIRPFCIDGILDDKGNLIDIKTKPDSRDDAWKPDYLLYHAPPEKWKEAWKIDKWNTMRIRCIGKYPRITTWINNVMICDFDGETCPSPRYKKEILSEMLGSEGHIALQIHVGIGSWKKDATCRFKNIRIKEL